MLVPLPVLRVEQAPVPVQPSTRMVTNPWRRAKATLWWPHRAGGVPSGVASLRCCLLPCPCTTPSFVWTPHRNLNLKLSRVQVQVLVLVLLLVPVPVKKVDQSSVAQW